MDKTLVAVIVTFNRLDKLKKTVEKTLLNNFYAVVIVNNCSSDGTREWLDALNDPRLDILHSEQNLGGAGGFNLGFAYVAEQLPQANWLVCFDDDAYPESDVADRFERLDIPEEVGGIAGAVYLPDGRICEMNRPSRNPFWHLKDFLRTATGGRLGFHVDDDSYKGTSPIDIDSSSFVGCFIRVSLIREETIGLPRSELFIYADDIIYLLELRKAGLRHWFFPTLKFSHDCATLLDQQDVYHPLWKAYYVLRNRLEMYRVASGMFYPLVLIVKIPTFFLAYRYYNKREQKHFLRVARQAIRHGLKRDFRKTHAEVLALSSLEG